MRLIDLDATIANIAKPGIYDLTDTEEFLKEQPVVDATPVVRCKNCINYKKPDCQIQESLYGVHDDYCSYGERIDGGIPNETN